MLYGQCIVNLYWKQRNLIKVLKYLFYFCVVKVVLSQSKVRHIDKNFLKSFFTFYIVSSNYQCLFCVCMLLRLRCESVFIIFLVGVIMPATQKT